MRPQSGPPAPLALPAPLAEAAEKEVAAVVGVGVVPPRRGPESQVAFRLVCPCVCFLSVASPSVHVLSLMPSEDFMT